MESPELLEAELLVLCVYLGWSLPHGAVPVPYLLCGEGCCCRKLLEGFLWD